MSSPSITIKEYRDFLNACERSKKEAVEILVKYDFVTQLFLQETIDRTWGE